MEIGLVPDMLAVGIGFTLSSSRGLFALSRGHLLPKAFTRTSRWGTPVVGIAAFAAVSVFAIILDGNINWGVDSAGPYTGFFVAATLGGLLVMTTYLILSLAALKVVATGGWGGPRTAGWSDWSRRSPSGSASTARSGRCRPTRPGTASTSPGR